MAKIIAIVVICCLGASQAAAPILADSNSMTICRHTKADKYGY